MKNKNLEQKAEEVEREEVQKLKGINRFDEKLKPGENSQFYLILANLATKHNAWKGLAKYSFDEINRALNESYYAGGRLASRELSLAVVDDHLREIEHNPEFPNYSYWEGLRKNVENHWSKIANIGELAYRREKRKEKK